MERGDPASDVDVGQEKFDWIGWARDDRQNRGDDGDAAEHGDEEHSDDENDQHLWSVFKGHQAELLRQLSWAPRGLREVNMPGAWDLSRNVRVLEWQLLQLWVVLSFQWYFKFQLFVHVDLSDFDPATSQFPDST